MVKREETEKDGLEEIGRKTLWSTMENTLSKMGFKRVSYNENWHHELFKNEARPDRFAVYWNRDTGLLVCADSTSGGFVDENGDPVRDAFKNPLDQWCDSLWFVNSMKVYGAARITNEAERPIHLDHGTLDQDVTGALTWNFDFDAVNGGEPFLHALRKIKKRGTLTPNWGGARVFVYLSPQMYLDWIPDNDWPKELMDKQKALKAQKSFMAFLKKIPPELRIVFENSGPKVSPKLQTVHFRQLTQNYIRRRLGWRSWRQADARAGSYNSETIQELSDWILKGEVPVQKEKVQNMEGAHNLLRVAVSLAGTKHFETAYAWIVELSPSQIKKLVQTRDAQGINGGLHLLNSVRYDAMIDRASRDLVKEDDLIRLFGHCVKTLGANFKLSAPNVSVLGLLTQWDRASTTRSHWLDILKEAGERGVSLSSGMHRLTRVGWQEESPQAVPWGSPISITSDDQSNWSLFRTELEFNAKRREEPVDEELWAWSEACELMELNHWVVKPSMKGGRL